MNARPPVPSADVVAVLDAVADTALQNLPSAVAVSITLVNDFGSRTAAHSTRSADAQGQAQNAAGSALSVPIPVDDDGVAGSLNAFAVAADAFGEADIHTMTRLAGTAAAALMTDDIGGFVDRARAELTARGRSV